MSITREGYPSSFDVEARINQIPLEAMIEAVPTEWSATPLGLTTDAHVIKSQSEFYGQELPTRAQAYPDGMPPAVVDLLHTVIDGVRHRRGVENGASYGTASWPLLMSPELSSLHEAAISGRANALGLFVLGHVLDMPSIELGKITFEGHLWPKLREETKALFHFVNPDASWVSDTLDKGPRFGVATPMYNDEGDRQTVMDEPLQALMVRARKYRGELTPKARIREVVTFLIRIDEESGFDQSVAKQLQEVYNPRLASYATLGRVASLESFRQSLHDSIASDSEPVPAWAIPLTNTVYAYDPTWQARHPKPSQLAPDTEVWTEHLEQIHTNQQALFARQERLRAGGWLNK